VAHVRKKRNSYRDLVGKCEGQRPLGRYTGRYRWEEDVTVDLKEIEWDGVEWIHLAQDRDRWCAVVDVVMNFQVV
jgi:hypothetical protein